MIIWIVDLMPVKWTFTVEPPPAKSVLVKPETPYPFEQTRYYYSGSEPYFWHRLEELDARAAYFQKHLEKMIAKGQAQGAAYAARHLFRIARARARRESEEGSAPRMGPLTTPGTRQRSPASG